MVQQPSTVGSGTLDALDPNGDILTAGTSAAGNLAVAAFLPGGTPDATFGTGGIATANFPGGSDGRGIAVQPSDGKIVAAGFTTSAGLLARFLPPNTKIGFFTATQAGVGSPVAFTAWNIMDSNPSATIDQVAFYYLDSNNNPVLVGYGTQSNGVWTLSPVLTSGSYNFFAVAQDNNAASDPSGAVTLAVQ
jgi:hypothetical protein